MSIPLAKKKPDNENQQEVPSGRESQQENSQLDDSGIDLEEAPDAYLKQLDISNHDAISDDLYASNCLEYSLGKQGVVYIYIPPHVLST